MRIIPRVKSENDYKAPKIVNEIKQSKYNSLPFNIFFNDIEEEVLDLFENKFYRGENPKFLSKNCVGDIIRPS